MGEGTAPIIRRAFQQAKIVGNFAVVQAVVQMIGFLSGILLVRTLEQRDYAYFTIANTMQGTLNVLADIGISVGLVSIGGRVWQDRHRFGQLVNTALTVRKKLGAVAILVVTPVLYFLLVRNGAPFFYTTVLIVVVLAGFLIQLSLSVLAVVPRLRSDIARIQSIDLTGALARLLVLLALMYFFLNAGVAIMVATAALLLQCAMLRKYVAGVIDLSAPENAEDRAAMFGFVRKLAANAVFFCLQGQITVFLISFFAHSASAIAEVGALGRLAMIFAVLSNLLTNVFVPAFARCQSTRKLRWLYTAIIGGVGAFGLVVLCGAAIFPEQFLFLLGNKYFHLHRELLLIVGGAVLSSLAGTFWALNASRAWVAGSWLYIPLTLATQIALVPYTDFSSVKGVLTFNLLSAIPNLLLNIVLSYRGFRSFQSARG
ncbi:MAG TPA: polysaccharide biosynthesis protein [Spartobacteria bacterium]|jgi:O-antigen/teichoic acid export membrane protein|nr:polysaccharide biosynthesis protein [Spartobacteria bacterium]HAK07445.1 polysaccharide biosynthesis protein [Spartobacteria bacterium]HCP91678.1 polysaccharide biosynthesis protein [Spartobacteria bacterium]